MAPIGTKTESAYRPGRNGCGNCEPVAKRSVLSVARQCYNKWFELSRFSGTMRFGISTHLFHDQRLSRDHLAQIASHGFEAVELFAKRSHFDYHDPAAVAQLAGWLKETGLVLHGVHAPMIDNATADAAKRQEAIREADAALNIARRIPADV